MKKCEASYISRMTRRCSMKVDKLSKESEERAVLEPSEECVPQSSSHQYDDDSEELEENSEEVPSSEPEEDPEEEPSEELEEDPEVDPEEEPEEESIERLEEDPKEESGEEAEEEKTDKPSEYVSQSLLNCNNDETEEPIGDPSEVSGSHIDEAEHQSGPKVSNEKKRSLDAREGELAILRGHQSQKRCRQEGSSNLESDFQCVVPDILGQSEPSMALNNNFAFKQQEGTGSSGKRRRSRWDPQCEGHGDTKEDEARKRRKTRWANDSQLKMLGPIQLPDFMSGCVDGFDLDPEIKELKAQLSEINCKLQRPELHDDRLEDERSPSPEPVYNNLGIRKNTREVRLRQKLVQKRQHVISMLIQKNPIFNLPSDSKPTKLFKKLYIPVKEYPGYNFIGLIIGPRGNTQKRMEKETGARILIRGKGSSSTKKKFDSENEDLHVYIEADNQKSLDAAVGMVEKLLIPIDERMNEHKLSQLKELAKLEKTSIDVIKCRECGEKGHHRYACPNLRSTFKIVSCDSFGSNSHPTTTCPLTASSPFSNSWQGSSCFGLGMTANTQNKPNKEISDANLYVGYLPQVVEESLLKELFSPFGKITDAKVIKDRTTGLSKGYGFVKFENPTDAAVAVTHLNGYKMDGKMLAVRVAGRQPVVRSSVLYHLPSYPGQAAFSPNFLSQNACPGPSGSLLSDPQASFSQSEGMSSHSTPIYTGHGDLLPQSEALQFTPLSSVSSISDSDSASSLHSFYNLSNQILFSSPSSLAQFPGDPVYQGSSFQSYLTTPTFMPSPQ